MKWTGLTGGIATGKSTAAKIIGELGYTVVDADFISRDLTKVGQIGYEKIVSHFGTSILAEDKTLDRKKLGDLVFNDLKIKDQLEQILHPLIKAEVAKQRQLLAEKGCQQAFYDVPLLFEKNMQSQFDSTVLIWCNAHVQLQRLMTRNNLNEVEAMARINNQMSLMDKIKLADHGIDNSTNLNDLKTQIQFLLTKVL